MGMISDLINKQTNVESVLQMALKNNSAISELLEGIQSSQDQIRYNSFKVVLPISENHPELLYPYWALFEKMLTSNNSYLKLIAVQIIANLTKIDTEKRFEILFDRYFNELSSKKTMVAAHIASNAGKIARAKPGLQSKITDILINIDSIYKGKQIDLIKGYAIEAFNQYIDKTSEKENSHIMEFVKEEQDNHSPRTRKKAMEFLNKWG